MEYTQHVFVDKSPDSMEVYRVGDNDLAFYTACYRGSRQIQPRSPFAIARRLLLGAVPAVPALRVLFF
jgi:hypothetical protein